MTYKQAQYRHDRLMPSDDREYSGVVEIEIHVYVPVDEWVDATLDYDLDYGEVHRVHEAHLYSAADLAYLTTCTHAGGETLQDIAEQAFDASA